MQPTSPPSVARDARLWVLAAGNFAIGTGALIVSGVLPLMAHDLGRSIPVTGQTVTAFALAVAIGGPLLAGPTSRFDRRLILQIALACFVAGNALGALAPSYELLMASRVLAGLGAALFTPHASVAASLMLPAELRGRAISLVFVGYTASTVLGVPLGTVAGDVIGWRLTLGAIAALALLALVGVRMLLPPALLAPPIDTSAWGRVLASRRILLILLVTLAQALGQFMLLAYIAPALHAAIGATSSVLGLMFMVFGVLGILGNLVGGALIDRVGPGPVVNLTILTVGAGLALFPLTALGFVATALIMALWGFGAFVINSAQQPRLIAAAPALASATLPLNSSAIYAGQAIGAAAGGGLLAHVGIEALAPVGAVCMMVALLLSLAAQRTEKAA
jgi:predicted MFS family arabinose efflux permease